MTSGSTELTKPRQKEQAWLEQGWAVGHLADKADGMFWNILDFTNEFSCQVDRFNKAKEQI